MFMGPIHAADAIFLLALLLSHCLASPDRTVSEALAAEGVCISARPGTAAPACFLNALQTSKLARLHRDPEATGAAVTLRQDSSPIQLTGGASIHAVNDSFQSEEPRRGLIKVLGVGLPKTGTSSLAMALTRLGFRTSHGEFLEMTSSSGVWKDWQNGDPWPALNSMLEMGYDAATDRPWCFAYKEFLQLNPSMKVILNRAPGGPFAWTKSMFKWSWTTRWQGLKEWNSTLGVQFSIHMNKVMLNCTATSDVTPDLWRACKTGYERWYEQVQADVPPNQLLDYSVCEGWQPLCDFLEIKDCPREPFPNLDKPDPMVAGEIIHDMMGSMAASVGFPHDDPLLPPLNMMLENDTSAC